MFIKPDYNVEKLEDIDFQALKEQGKKVLLFDLDSTVMPSKSGEYLPKTKELLQKLKKDFTIAILSNNSNSDYIKKVRAKSDFAVISHAKKPSTKVLREYLTRIGKTTDDAVLIGDRPLTDILCGKNAKITTILVDSVTKDTEHKIVRFVRWLERLTIRK
ncbi:MAG: YqeG family HAD IIIA-type phosphatase [Candidatus Gastranaerophilales bacterium]|nr:YqeG family HAD IIIA-type phosphatase [Candidatus Gastranaerophilales bacterium]